jgi:tape measure domain-containing protein
MSSLNFSVAINLLTDNFKKGTAQVKSGFEQMKSQVLGFVGAFGIGGIGLMGFLTKIISVSRETAKANMVLRNSSGSVKEFADNLQFCNGIAQKYGLYINDITTSFAKFTDGARASGISLKDQKDIFESLSRASQTFGLSSENTQTVFQAVTNMMNRGVISSRDLRGALGKQIPVAMQAMAMACNTSVVGLNKLVKSGIDAKNIMPAFAKALKELTPNVDLDTAETNINRLKNSIQNFGKNTNVLGYYNSGIKALISLVNWAANNIKTVVESLVAYLVGSKLASMWSSIQSGAEKTYGILMSRARRAAKDAGENFDKAQWKAENSFNAIKYGAIRAGAAIKTAFMAILPTAILTGITLIIEKLTEYYQESKRIKNIWAEYEKGVYSATHTTEIEQLKVIQQQYNKANGNVKLQAKYVEQINSLLGTHLTTESNINSVLSARIKLLEQAAAAEYYANKKVQADSSANDIVSKYGNASNYNYLIRQFNKEYGKVPIKNLNNLIGKWARSGQSITGSNGVEYSLNDLYKDKSEYNQQRHVSYDAHQNIAANMSGNNNVDYNPNATVPSNKKKKKRESELERVHDRYISDYKKLDEQLKSGDIKQADYNVSLDKLNKNTLTELSGLKQKGVKQSPFYKNLKAKTSNKGLIAEHELEKVQSDYADKVKLAQTEAEKGTITQSELSEKLSSLATDAANQALSIKGIGKAADSFIKSLKGDIASAELMKVQSDYVDQVDEQKSLLAKGGISQEACNKNIAQLSLDAADAAAKIKNIGNRADGFIKKTRETAQQTATVSNRDTTFDYGKSKYDIAQEEYETHIENLKAQFGELSEKVRIAQTDADSFKKAMDLAKIQEDIKSYEKEVGLLGGNYKKFETIKNGIENIYSAWENVKSSFKDKNAFEGVLSILDAITSTVDSIDETINAMEEVSKAINNLTAAKKKEAVVTSQTTAQKVADNNIGMESDVASATTTAATGKSDLVANTASVGSSAAKGAAKLPFPWNIVAIGGAVAAVIGIMSQLKFANGGIVPGGSYSGDHVLANVNSGEMILNGVQQSKLFKAINSGDISGSGSINSVVTSKVRGTDLLLTINNQLKLKGKKTL